MRAALYVRVSTDEQADEGYSLDAQISALKDYCEIQDIEIAGIYRDDGFSGRKTNRPAYRRMIEEIDNWDKIIVLKMDRIHRNSRNFMDMMDMLEKHGKKFESTTESIDTDNAMGRFVVDMMQRIAQLESEQIGERTHFGMREKAESMDTSDSPKRTMGFTPPFGYELYEGALKSCESEMIVVKEIFSMYSSGRTIDSICYELNGEGTLTRKGNPWNKFNLRNILHNPVYAGYMRWEDLLIKHEAETALSPEEFNSVQQKMASKVRDPAKRRVGLIPTE